MAHKLNATLAEQVHSTSLQYKHVVKADSTTLPYSVAGQAICSPGRNDSAV
jgi:hypothetical protein